ncbi:hypothetical protein Nepgr_001553 [Nepenthes gracilis]|uniref:Uncharacterized protein n=1 Tax=Nepenthes gracilis TaxID=150966 RepID=A0AAD3P4M7_NEPGR|nr:hypothetical protein Nepgr_001553 [Nepenthes gracilis]
MPSDVWLLQSLSFGRSGGCLRFCRKEPQDDHGNLLGLCFRLDTRRSQAGCPVCVNCSVSNRVFGHGNALSRSVAKQRRYGEHR